MSVEKTGQSRTVTRRFVGGFPFGSAQVDLLFPAPDPIREPELASESTLPQEELEAVPTTEPESTETEPHETSEVVLLDLERQVEG